MVWNGSDTSDVKYVYVAFEFGYMRKYIHILVSNKVQKNEAESLDSFDMMILKLFF